MELLARLRRRGSFLIWNIVSGRKTTPLGNKLFVSRNDYVTINETRVFFFVVHRNEVFTRFLNMKCIWINKKRGFGTTVK